MLNITSNRTNLQNKVRDSFLFIYFYIDAYQIKNEYTKSKFKMRIYPSFLIIFITKIKILHKLSKFIRLDEHTPITLFK